MFLLAKLCLKCYKQRRKINVSFKTSIVEFLSFSLFSLVLFVFECVCQVGEFGFQGKEWQNCAKMGRRCICVEVNCGDIRERYHFYTDNLISGGANVMIEVARQALAELTKSLLKKGFYVPDCIMFQYDNCGENKNQFLMGFFSMLVETKQVKYVELHFLLVGHTHCSVDQYFSVLSKVSMYFQYAYMF